jgi:hypothetical protein
MRSRLLQAGLLVAVASGGCSTEPSDAFGVWGATTFKVIPAGGAEIDLLQAGATLTIIIDAENETSGSLSVPAGIASVAPLNASMDGTARVTGTTVEFDQDAATFVRDLTWSLGALTMTVESQSIGGDVWTITLTRM